jgi:hypothetical protein
VAEGPKSELPEAPRLPQRAAIYIAPDGKVTFGALFEDLVPVAAAISATPNPRGFPLPLASDPDGGT